MSIDVYATASAIEKDLRQNVVIVVDVFRATSSIVTAVENGCKSVIPVLEIEDAVAMQRRFSNERVLLCGERKGLAIDGFHLSNSPLEFTQDMVSGRVLIMTTTNGTRAILGSGDCKKMLMGSLLNAGAVAKAALQENENISIVCAGTEGRYSMDDILCSGAIISRMLDLGGKHALCDLSRTALALYDSYKEDLFANLSGSLHFERLRAIGKEEDIRYCLQEDRMQAVPQYENGVIRRMP